jgi:hypothetical protein
VKDILAHWAKDNKIKLTSPVIGAFISAWVLFNWDKFLLLFWGDGTLDERLKCFQGTANFSDLQCWLWPLLLALVYVFGLPYLNVITQKLKRHSELLRHNEVVGTDIAKEIKLGELNEHKYKSNPENDYIGRKIKADIDLKEANAKKVKAEAEKVTAIAEQAKIDMEKAKVELNKTQQTAERESLSHEKAKLLHENLLASARFPMVYEYIKRLSENLKEDGIVLSLETITNSLAAAFGFSSDDELVCDPKFTLKNIKDLSFVAYEPEEILEKLKDILEAEKTDAIAEGQLFDYLIQLFDEIDHCKFISSESIEDEAMAYFEENQFDLIQSSELSGLMAETNAFFDEVDDPQIMSVNFEQELKQWEVTMTCYVSGTSHEDKPFSGDSIGVTLTVAYPIALGTNGVGAPEFIDVSGSVEHPE